MVCLDRSDIFHESKSVLAGASGATVSACRWTAGLTSGRLSFGANSRCVLCRSPATYLAGIKARREGIGRLRYPVKRSLSLPGLACPLPGPNT